MAAAAGGTILRERRLSVRGCTVLRVARLPPLPATAQEREAFVNVRVVGAGTWGTTFAALLRDHSHDVVLACRDREQAQAIDRDGRNPRYARSVDRLSTLVEDRPVAVLSGPNMAEEVAAGLPTAAVLASRDEELALRLQHELSAPTFRVYVNSDVVGVELCAAAKNVIALAVGGLDGLGLGDNAKAALITRGLAEMARLGEAAGGRPQTFAGLAGMGDLIVTCWHPSGRNRRAGELIARGATPEEAAAEIGQVVEGLTTAPALRELSERLGVELPITEGVCRVLEGGDLADLLSMLISSRPKEE